jgi:hypothetical protein
LSLATDKLMRSIESGRLGVPRTIRILASHGIELLEGVRRIRPKRTWSTGSVCERTSSCSPRQTVPDSVAPSSPASDETRDVLEAAGVADVGVRVDGIVAA